MSKIVKGDDFRWKNLGTATLLRDKLKKIDKYGLYYPRMGFTRGAHWVHQVKQIGELAVIDMFQRSSVSSKYCPMLNLFLQM